MLGGVTLALVAGSATAADASHQGAVGKITYTTGAGTFTANEDGTGVTQIASGANTTTAGAWSPDGSRYAYTALDGTVRTVRQNGGAALHLTRQEDGAANNPDWSAYGQRVYFSRAGQLWSTSSDGTFYEVPLGENPANAFEDDHPTVSDRNDVIFQRHSSATGFTSIYKYNPASPAAPVELVDRGVFPDFAPGGDRFVYVAEDNNLWTADISGVNKVQLTTDGGVHPAFSPDGTKVTYLSAGAIKTVNVATKAVTTVKSNGSNPSWQSVRRNVIQRVSGDDGTETAIAASQWNYVDHGSSGDGQGRVPAGAVVLSRSDTYLDALVGSALATKESAPLLITAPDDTVELRVLAEIKRVLGTSGTIHLLGGTDVMPQGMQNQLASLGYTVNRLAGDTHYETALAIDNEITGGAKPGVAIVTTGANYYDALAAGAAAGAYPGTVIVLTDGEGMPASSAEYLNGLNPDYANGGTAIVTAGSPGDDALINAYYDGQIDSWGDQWFYFPLVGDNEMDTALDVAKFFFAAPTNVATSTNRDWQDALTGGAMIGAANGPLLLTDPDQLYGPVRDYLSEGAGSIFGCVILGGNDVMPDALIAPFGNAISVQGQYDYTSLTPTISAGGGKNPLRAQTVVPKGSSEGRTAQVPGLRTVKATAGK
ncbi:cell wall-binding repeat-containing protein [Dactylosporangium sp. NPDC005555]|uniref:cell wall-binding repeat-containing protein n=1 Tax=Dactylosporangium sp. NPDC005555 TaxID=3154889 RepID=UPI0033A9C5A3